MPVLSEDFVSQHASDEENLDKENDIDINDTSRVSHLLPLISSYFKQGFIQYVFCILD